MPKNSDVVIFPRISNPMRRICCNKETFSVDLSENNHAGNKCWGLVFDVVKSKILAYYRLWSKDPTAALTLDALCNFIAEHGIPRMIITDSDVVLGEGKKCKHYLRQIFTPL